MRESHERVIHIDGFLSRTTCVCEQLACPCFVSSIVMTFVWHVRASPCVCEWRPMRAGVQASVFRAMLRFMYTDDFASIDELLLPPKQKGEGRGEAANKTSSSAAAVAPGTDQASTGRGRAAADTKRRQTARVLKRKGRTR